uniref:Addiction module component n=1 Tax=Candidatus Kentrum eta TaxID=2126337 RepID=A0A450UAU8_9GAMM|nr:MAG: Putative addiction module component [Candidatus Kentron sp. H]VFJ91123.1 MAG: Putative addiction module component [Candidatus Kentron sp. H]VFJ97439.1 MAG: Putative addiction module component [Candidatus Kentron sp. H]
MTMINSIQIAQMSRDEKPRAMETLWVDSSEDDTEINSPAWHNEVLEETKARVIAGEEGVEDWEAAKQSLRRGS